jgi:tripartite ATP-independent transporter DctM subunit
LGLTGISIGVIGIVAVLVLLAIRLPIGMVLALVAIGGIAAIRGLDVALSVIRTVPFDFAAHWELTAVPMFLLMGAFAYHSGISAALFKAARLWFAALPGGLAVASNFACAGFAAASGSSMATAAAMGRIAIPEMLRSGYDKGLATGTVASAGTLGAMIPPSILFVLYGIFAEASIGKLLIAGILPGILTAVIYASMIIIRCKLDPSLAPRIEGSENWGERLAALGEVWPILVLILAIIGGLYGGVVTPTEAGAFGAFVAFVIALSRGRMSLHVFRESCFEAVIGTARIFFVAIGAIMLTLFLTMSGLPAVMGQAIGSWAGDPLLLILAATVIFVILGMFLDPIGVLLVALPLLLPMINALKIDLIWFGVLVVKYLEIGLLTPPVGMNVYVIKSVVGDTVRLETIFWGVGWFLACEVVVVGLLIAFPQISLFLPSLMQ